MNILEAVKKAKEIDGYMTRPDFGEYFFIKPTNLFMNCMIINPDGHSTSVGRGWQPQERDFLAEDWEVVSKAGYIAMVDWNNTKEAQRDAKKAERELHDERSAKRKWMICSVIMFVAMITQLVLK